MFCSTSRPSSGRARRDNRIAFPYGEDTNWDPILERPDRRLERVQVKYAESRNGVIALRCRSHSLTNGRVRQTKRYTAAMIEWLAVYDRTTDDCYYRPAAELGEGRALLHLRLGPARNGQQRRINWACDYCDI